MTHSTHNELISELSALAVCIMLAVPGVAAATELDCVGIGTCVTPADDGTVLGDSESNTIEFRRRGGRPVVQPGRKIKNRVSTVDVSDVLELEGCGAWPEERSPASYGVLFARTYKQTSPVW